MMLATPTVNFVDWCTIAFYVVLLCSISIYHSRRIKNRDDILLAGRSMSRWPIAISMYMALFSTNTFVGVTGWLNRPNGTVWIGLQNIGMMSAVPLVVWLYPSLFFRLRITTAYEYLEKRFDYSVRAMAAVFFLAARIVWMATMLYSSGLVLSMMLGWTSGHGITSGLVRAILLMAALGTFFSLVGGMRAVIWTDVVQFFIMMGGVLVMAIYAVRHSGGFVEVIRIAGHAGKFSPPAFFSLTSDASMVGVFLLGFISMLSSSGADQVVLQTYLTAKNVQEAKASLWRNGMLLKPMSLIFPLLGLLMFVYYHTHPAAASLMRGPDDALSVFVLNVLPVGLRGLMVVAILSAVIDSVASGMAATTACVQVDFIQRWRRRPLSDRAAAMLARGLILTWGVLIALAALWVRTLGEKNNILQILNIIMYPFTGVLLGIFLVGILTRRANAPGTLIGAIAGFVSTVAIPLSSTCLRILEHKGITTSPEFAEAIARLSRVSNFYYGALGMIITFAVGYLASLLFAPPPPQKTAGLTHHGQNMESVSSD